MHAAGKRVHTVGSKKGSSTARWTNSLESRIEGITSPRSSTLQWFDDEIFFSLPQHILRTYIAFAYKEDIKRSFVYKTVDWFVSYRNADNIDLFVLYINCESGLLRSGAKINENVFSSNVEQMEEKFFITFSSPLFSFEIAFRFH